MEIPTKNRVQQAATPEQQHDDVDSQSANENDRDNDNDLDQVMEIPI